MNIGTNERDHPNSSPLTSPAGPGTMADGVIKQVRRGGREIEDRGRERGRGEIEGRRGGRGEIEGGRGEVER